MIARRHDCVDMEKRKRRENLAGRRRLAARGFVQDESEEGRGVRLPDVQVEDARFITAEGGRRGDVS